MITVRRIQTIPSVHRPQTQITARFIPKRQRLSPHPNFQLLHFSPQRQRLPANPTSNYVLSPQRQRLRRNPNSDYCTFTQRQRLPANPNPTTTFILMM